MQMVICKSADELIVNDECSTSLLISKMNAISSTDPVHVMSFLLKSQLNELAKEIGLSMDEAILNNDHAIVVAKIALFVNQNNRVKEKFFEAAWHFLQINLTVRQFVRGLPDEELFHVLKSTSKGSQLQEDDTELQDKIVMRNNLYQNIREAPNNMP